MGHTCRKPVCERLGDQSTKHYSSKQHLGSPQCLSPWSRPLGPLEGICASGAPAVKGLTWGPGLSPIEPWREGVLEPRVKRVLRSTQKYSEVLRRAFFMLSFHTHKKTHILLRHYLTFLEITAAYYVPIAVLNIFHFLL